LINGYGAAAVGKRAGKRIGLREVRTLGPGETVWDTEVLGFCIRCQRSKAVTYGLKYRTLDGRQRWHTIGRHGSPWTPDQARTEARRLLNHVIDGGDPAGAKQERRQALDVGELLDDYLAAAVAGRLLTKDARPKKPSTIYTDRCRIEAHIRPALGRLKVAVVTSADMERLMHEIADGGAARARAKPHTGAPARGGRGAATRTLGLLGGVFTYAVKQRMRGDNPVRGLGRFADGKRTRRLTDAEYAMFAAGLALSAGAFPATAQGRGRRTGAVPPSALAATRFLLLTGWRRAEALGLTWGQLDLARRTARLEDTKTGASVRPLSVAACEVLRSMPGVGRADSSAHVFPNAGSDGRMGGFPWQFARIVKESGLPPDVTPHVLRHSFASLAGDIGLSEPTIAALIGHQRHTMTSRYIHSADAVLLAAADAVAGRTAKLMGEKAEPGKVVPLLRGKRTAAA